ncbi:hypothetical protein [Aquimarina algicola]|uniref:Uncharacterized protein n=1 Tax=Aquimarina algicola TaxID=2589995 RepID=A0A504J6X9_9FLAO|nr:hypothetical protein [Aquimarina algicola]TPN82849.1 hypothetical protein FHK87_20705 [Aquimarina algicola]
MKQSILKLTTLLFITTLIISCSSDDDATSNPDVGNGEEPVTFSDLEDEWVRLSLIREDKIEVMQAAKEEMIGSVETGMPQDARYYPTNSGRYLTVVNRGENKVLFFDTGVINHTDHGHQQQVRWLDLTLETAVPTHFTSVNGNMVIFNDGDGSITYVEEDGLELPAYTPKTMQLENTKGHHGVGIALNNGKFAVTFQSDTPPAGYEWGPQMVKYVTSEGAVIDNNGGVLVEGIHGSANNGSYGGFGSTDGIIIVDNQDNIDLIPNVDDNLRNERGYWIGTLKSHANSKLFYGRASNIGIYAIDPEKKSMNLLYEGSDVKSDMLSFHGEYYLLHTEDNKIRVYDANTSTLITERVVEMADIPDSPLASSKFANSEIAQLKQQEQESPVLVCSDQYLYVLAPNRTDIKVLSITDLKHVHTIRLENAVKGIAKNGFTTEGEGNPDHQH